MIAAKVDANQGEIVPWTWREFMAAMRKAGYKGIGHGCYVHKETRAKFMAWDWTKYRQEKYGRGEAWIPFAIDHTTPTDAPF